MRRVRMDLVHTNSRSSSDRQHTGLFVADHVDAMLAYWDKDEICRFANNAYKKWFGRGREDMVNKMTMSEVLGPLYEKNLVYIQGALNGIQQQFERDIRLPSGELRHTIANYFPDIRDGKVLGFSVHVADITALKKLELELNQTNEIARIGSWEINLKTSKVTWSSVTCAIHDMPAGFEPDVETAIKFYKEGPNRDLISDAVEKAMKDGTPYDLELVLITASGKEKWARTIGQAEFEKGQCIRMFGTIQDIDHQRKTQDELKISEERFRGSFEHSAIGMALVSIDGKWLKVNQKLCQILGYTEEELLSTTFQEITHPDDLDMDMGNVHKMLDGSIDAYSMEKRYFHKSGKIVWGTLSVSLVKDLNGNPRHFVSQVEDITERKIAIETQNKLNRELTAIFDSGTQVSIIATTTEGIITHFNKGAEILLGYEAAELIGKHTPALLHKESEVIIRGHQLTKECGREIKGFDVFVEYARQGKHDSREWTYIRKDGTTFPIQLVVTAIRDTSGSITGFLGIGTDLTERKLAEENIVKYRELEAKNNEMEQFTYVASHDLREPLITMSSFAQLLVRNYKGKLDSEADEYLGYMMKSADRMMELIKDLLDYSRIGVERNLQTADCNEIVNTVIHDLDVNIKEANAIIKIEKLPVIKGYTLELHALFQNLISNALKFRKVGQASVIKISAEKENGKWLFMISDNGMGIEDKDIDRIFVMFKRLHNKSDIAGTGIGLALCKKIVDMHHGNIWVESVYGQGSTFCFTLATTA